MIRFIFSSPAVRPLPLTVTKRQYYPTISVNRKELLENLHALRALLNATQCKLKFLKLTVSKRERRPEQKRLKQIIKELTQQEDDALQKWLDDCKKQN